jgi:integrase
LYIALHELGFTQSDFEAIFAFRIITEKKIQTAPPPEDIAVALSQIDPNVAEEHLPSLRPYDFRHCFASAAIHRWLNEGRNIDSMMPFLRAYMGHTTFESTYYYVHLLPETLKRSAGIDLSAFEKLLPEVEA